jgi:hypothetical protein
MNSLIFKFETSRIEEKRSGQIHKDEPLAQICRTPTVDPQWQATPTHYSGPPALSAGRLHAAISRKSA